MSDLDVLFNAVLWRMYLYHSVLYGNYDTPATLSWNVNEPEAEVLETR